MDNFFDLQVNGYGGVDFNGASLTAEQLHGACQKLAADGVQGILATIISEHLDVMQTRLRRLVELRERDALVKRVIAGFHVEGPFISPEVGFRGAHPADAIVPASIERAQSLLDAGGGLIRLITLAPECDVGARVTRFLCEQGVRVAAGHTDASLDELCAACDAGLSLFTHVGNGCPLELNRHDNIVQRALSLSDRLWLCFIADGAHVPFFALGNYLRAANLERCVIVTDAIAPAGLGPGTYTLARWTLAIGEDMVARAPDGSHLVGSAVTMAQSAANLRARLGLSAAQIALLTRDNPRRALEN